MFVCEVVSLAAPALYAGMTCLAVGERGPPVAVLSRGCLMRALAGIAPARRRAVARLVLSPMYVGRHDVMIVGMILMTGEW